MTAYKTLVPFALMLVAGCSSEASRNSFRPDGVKATDYPFAVTVDGYDATGSRVVACSGSVVSPKLVLTAGNCAKAATWQVTAPYAGNQTATAHAATPTDWQGVAEDDPTFDPKKSDTGYIALDQEITLDKYPSLADSSACMGCEVVHIGRVAHAVSDSGAGSDVDRATIAPGNAGGPIIRVADGAILGVQAGTVDTRAAIMARPRRQLGTEVQFPDGHPTFWSSTDLYVSPLHVGIANEKSVVLFPQHLLLNLPMQFGKPTDQGVQALVAATGIAGGSVPATLKQYVGPNMLGGGQAPTVTTNVPSDVDVDSSHAQALRILAVYLPPYPYTPPGGIPNRPGTSPNTPGTGTLPNTPGTGTLPNTPGGIPGSPFPSPNNNGGGGYTPPYQNLGNLINLAGNIAGAIGTIGLIGSLLGGGLGLDMGGCS